MKAERRKQPALGRIHAVHMVGIGGIGMSSIAEVLLNRGYTVSGSDLETSEVTEHLVELGATIHEGHAAGNVQEADVVVYSSAIDTGKNPETLVAEERRIPLISRAVMLGELMRMHFGIGIAGTHGKTTTTTMTGLVVAAGGFDPTIIVGGKVAVFGSNAVVGEGDIIVIEADEYDRTFLRLTPSIAVITSLEADHLDIYSGLDDLRGAFTQYANSVPFFGVVIACLDDANVQHILGGIDRRVVTYGVVRQAMIRATNISQEGLVMRFDVEVHGQKAGTVTLNAPGRHNMRNALAAIAVGLELDMPFDKICEGIARFSGVQRRFQQIGAVGDILVFDDYAHHPSEVSATLETASVAWPDRRLVAVFQPHLYSRTRDFREDFGRAFFNADVLVVTDIYGARETPEPGLSGEVVSECAQSFGHRDVHYVADINALPDFLDGLVRPGDVVMMLGAGTIWRSSRKFVELLKETRS